MAQNIDPNADNDSLEVIIGIMTQDMGNGHNKKALACEQALLFLADKLASSGVKINSNFYYEKSTLSEAAIKLKTYLEHKVNDDLFSKTPYGRNLWTRITYAPGVGSIKIIEGIVSLVNKLTGGSKKFNHKKNDAYILTHPSAKRVLGITEPTVVLVPDAVLLSIYTFDMQLNVVYTQVKRTIQHLLSKENTPDSTQIFNTGLFYSTSSLDDNLKPKRNFEGILSKDKIPIMVQSGGAGAQEQIFLEMIDRIDYSSVSPLFVTYSNKKMFMNLLERAGKSGYVTDSEYDGALARIERINRDKTKEEEDAIFAFASGLRILYHPDKFTSIKKTEAEKLNSLLNIVKWGDVTSGGCPIVGLFPIGYQELLNLKWTMRNRFGLPLSPFTAKDMEEIMYKEEISAERLKQLGISKELYSDLVNERGVVSNTEGLVPTEGIRATIVKGALNIIKKGYLIDQISGDKKQYCLDILFGRLAAKYVNNLKTNVAEKKKIAKLDSALMGIDAKGALDTAALGIFMGVYSKMLKGHISQEALDRVGNVYDAIAQYIFIKKEDVFAAIEHNFPYC